MDAGRPPGARSIRMSDTTILVSPAGALPRGVEAGCMLLPRESLRVETLRGLACMLLVAYHVIGSHTASGLQISKETTKQKNTNQNMHLRMPLFTFLSGFVYAYRPVI